MTRCDWNETAREFAAHVGQYRFLVERGAVSVKFVDEGDREVSDEGPLVVGIFSSMNYLLEDRSQRELDLVREALREHEVGEIGFGTSPDGLTWAMLVAAEKNECQTAAGRGFQREMLKNALEDVVWHAWREVNEASKQQVGAGDD